MEIKNEVYNGTINYDTDIDFIIDECCHSDSDYKFEFQFYYFKNPDRPPVFGKTRNKKVLWDLYCRMRLIEDVEIDYFLPHLCSLYKIIKIEDINYIWENVFCL